MLTKKTLKVLLSEDLAYISTLNECERRLFKAMCTLHLRAQGISFATVSKIMGASSHILQRGIKGLQTETGPGKGRVRCRRGGRKALLAQHPEWVVLVKIIIDPSWSGCRRMRMSYGYPCQCLRLRGLCMKCFSRQLTTLSETRVTSLSE